MTFATADKNKSAFKLRNFGPIYYLNLDDQPERREYMEDQFKYWEIDNYERISAYDGREDDLGHIIKGAYPNMMTSGEIGCTTSHLKALKHWLETSDSDYAIIMEDDCSLETVKCWNFIWDDFSTACYMITRRHAQKLIDFHVRGDKYKLDNGVKPRPVADDLIYNSGNTYSIPLLLYKTDLGSSIHPEHIDAFHVGNYKAQLNYWTTNGARMSIREQMDYDPYLGRITENSAAIAAAKEAENPSS